MKDDGTGKPFLADASFFNLSSAQQTTLASGSYSSAQIVNFLRGDRQNESLIALRERSTVLGDIIHSRPLYIADATNPTVIVGANDGMLHAFNASTGSERWAYVPSMLLSKMKNLAANPYVHDYFVDGQTTIGTVSISGNKRVLVGGLGAGGKGLYALDITDLSAATDSAVASKVLWEITPSKVNYVDPKIYPNTTSATAYQNLGYTYGIPVIRKINNNGTLQDVVIVGNGINTCGSVGGASPAGCDYQAYLLIIDAATGKLVSAIKADTSVTTDGTSASPNGLFNPLAIDTDGDGAVDLIYAGDLNGTLWKFNLANRDPSTWANVDPLIGAASVLHTTSPAQPITATIDATTHPYGGYMVTFATGSELTGSYGTWNVATSSWTTDTTGELGDTSVYYVYGIWDGAPAANTTLVSQTLLERDYIYPPPPTVGGATTKVRRVSATAPVWTSGGNKGWKVPLQICDLTGQPSCASLGKTAGGERVIGEGAFISSGRYYINTHNPNIPYRVPGTDTVVMGENWQLALYFENGGTKELFMDLNSSGVVGPEDRIQYIASDALVLAGTKAVGDPITSPNQDGIAIGKWLSRGASAQPVLVKLTTLYTTLFNQNPDVVIPSSPAVEQGVTGGHFDTDIFYGSATGGAPATATITVGSSGQTAGYPATLGGISVDGVTIVPALSTTDIANGTATTTNAPTLQNKINGLSASSGYSATVSGSTVTVTAPFNGTAYNGKTFSITDGSSQTLIAAQATVTGVKASRTLTFTNGTSINPTGVSILVNGTNIMNSGVTTPGSVKTSAQLASWVASNSSSASYDITASSSTVTIAAKTAIASTYNINTLTASPAGVAPANGTLVISDATGNTSASIKCGTTYVGKSSTFTVANSNTKATRLNGVYTSITASQPVNGYTVSCTKTGNPTTSLNCTIAAPPGPSACSSFTLANINPIITATNTGPSGGSGMPTTTGTAITGVTAIAGNTQSGWSNFAPALAGGTFSGGSNGVVTGDTCDGSTVRCENKTHIHQYDDKFDVTGLNMLNASESNQNLSVALPSTGTNFKILMHNQYLNPAAKLHIADPSYVYNVDHGYISVKDYQTTASLDVTALPIYNRDTIGSLVINLPIDALTSKNWWGNGDIRSGLHPTDVSCAWKGDSSNDGNMYWPVIPPTNGVDGPGIWGYSASTTASTASGVRHGGALVIQIIASDTPQSAIELNDPLSRPEYGWRVNAANYSTYVLAEYAMYWHFGPCYGNTTATQSYRYNFSYSNSKDLSNFSFKIDGLELLTSNNPPSSTKTGLVTWILANKNTLTGYTVTGNSSTITVRKADNTLPVLLVTATGLATGDSQHTYTRWTKAPFTDSSGCTPSGTNTYCTAPAAGATDPHIGNLSAGVSGDVSAVTTDTVGNVTTQTITYTDGTRSTKVTTQNADGTTTIVTTDRTGTTTTTTIASTGGGSGTSGLLSGSTSGIGRISWRELIRK